MAKNVKPVPEGFHTVTPYLVQRDAKRALEFYKKAFGAETRVTMPGPDGRIMHAEIRIGDSMMFLSDEIPEMSPETKSPQSAGCTPIRPSGRESRATFWRRSIATTSRRSGW